MTGTGLAGCRILLMEDEFLIALEIADALSEAGAEVSGPHVTLSAAEEAAQTEAADLAVLDIDLKGEEVFPAARHLRQRGIPFIFYTGQPEREILRTEFRDVPVCVKPCQPARLIGELTRLLPLVA
jgi:DNA-binding response OmpR family regulator